MWWLPFAALYASRKSQEIDDLNRKIERLSSELSSRSKKNRYEEDYDEDYDEEDYDEGDYDEENYDEEDYKEDYVDSSTRTPMFTHYGVVFSGRYKYSKESCKFSIEYGYDENTFEPSFKASVLSVHEVFSDLEEAQKFIDLVKSHKLNKFFEDISHIDVDTDSAEIIEVPYYLGSGWKNIDIE